MGEFSPDQNSPVLDSSEVTEGQEGVIEFSPNTSPTNEEVNPDGKDEETGDVP